MDGIPILLSRDPKFQDAMRISAAYDSIYGKERNVWQSQGRTTPEFVNYFSSLLGQRKGARFLEIGCGEGFLLASLSVGEKFAVDVSIEAIKAAQTRTEGHFSVALAERLPFPDEYFDLVASVGVMEHFLNDKAATREIKRILKSGGHYVALIDVNLTFWERLRLKFSEYVFPRPRPIQLGRWLRTKLALIMKKQEIRQLLPRQPVQNQYTTRSGKACLQKSGLKVIDIIHTRKHPELPLIGHFVVIYVAQKWRVPDAM